MQCLVGLGNPGLEYAETRHNVGFRVIDVLAARHGLEVTRHRFRAIYGRGKLAGEDCLLVKPQTFMNDSGEAVSRVLHFYKLEPDSVLLIYDDLNLDLGVLRFRRGGSDGGHKGVRSVIRHLHTDQVARLRLGIGRLAPGAEAINYVLSPFSRSEAPQVSELVDRAAEAVVVAIRDGLETAMNAYNS